jgi:hypothetical protein
MSFIKPKQSLKFSPNSNPLPVKLRLFSALKRNDENLLVEGDYGCIKKDNVTNTKNVNANDLTILGKYNGYNHTNGYQFDKCNIPNVNVNDYYWYKFEDNNSRRSIFSWFSRGRKSKGGKKKNKRKTQRRRR